MTTTQLALLMGIIYIAPHVRRDTGLFIGLIFLIIAVIKQLL